MLYHVRMDVRIPHDLDPDTRTAIIAEERDYAQQLMRAGTWVHLWRIAGEYANYSIFDVDSHDELHELLSGLPLFPYLQLHVTPLAIHPSDITGSDA